MIRSFGRGERTFRGLTAATTGITLAAFAVVVAALVLEASSNHAPAFGAEWSPGVGVYGLLPLTIGTVLSSFLALAVAAPISVLAAAWIVDLAPHGVRGRALAAVEVGATVPAVVYGLWGRSVIVPAVAGIGSSADATSAHGFGLLSSSIVLGAMVLPTITATCCRVLRAVPDSLRVTAVALGATPWEALRGVVLPVARRGIAGAIVIGLGRALGESVAVEMVCGSSPVVPSSIFGQTSTLGVVLLDQYVEATSAAHRGGLAQAALVLCLVAVLVGLAGRRLSARVRSNVGALA